MFAVLVVIVAIAGLFFGRLAAIAAERIPERRKVLRGWNECPKCGAAHGPADNLPLLDYLNRRRCRECGASLSPSYPLLEIGAALLFAAAAARFGFRLETAVYAGFFWVLLVLSAIDLQHRLLLDRIVLPSLATGAVGLTAAAILRGYPAALSHAAVGAAIFGGFLFVVAFINPAGMGGGDVKLSFLLGMFLGYLDGWGVVLVGMFLSFLFAGLVGVVLIVVSKEGRKAHVPFGPFLAAGTTVGIFLGHWILSAYLG